MKIVLFSCCVTNKIQEQLKEGSLMIYLIILSKAAIENLQNGLQSMLQKDVGIIACN